MERKQLISAYVWREMSVAERQAADELLRVDPQFKQQVEKFSEWSEWLKQGRLEVTPEMIQSLRKRIEERLTAETTTALVAIRCSGEFNATEKAQLEREISKNPALRATSERLEKFTQKLEVGKLEVSDKLQAALRHNVQAAIAMKPRRLPKSQPKPTVRIYVAPEVSNPWTFRISAAAAVVALLAAGGVYVATQKTGTSNIATATSVKNTDPEVVNHDKPEVVHTAQAPNFTPDIQPQPDLKPDPVIVEEGSKPPAAVPNIDHKVVPTVPEKRIIAKNDTQPTTPVDPAPVVPKNDRIANNNQQVAPAPDLVPSPAPNGVNPGDRIATGPRNGNGGGGGGSIGTLPANPNLTVTDGDKAPKQGPDVADKGSNQKTPKTPNPKVEQPAPETLFAIAETVMGNTALFTPEAGGATSIRKNAQIPSGSEITSGPTHFNLTLPGGSELYVNVNSSLVLKFERSGAATVILKAGEVYYVGKNVKVEIANQYGIALTGKSVDAKVTSSSAIFGIVRYQATVTAGGKKANYSAPNVVVVPFGQDPQAGSMGNAIAWTGDLGANPNGKNEASENPEDGKNKNRSRKKN